MTQFQFELKVGKSDFRITLILLPNKLVFICIFTLDRCGHKELVIVEMFGLEVGICSKDSRAGEEFTYVVSVFTFTSTFKL
jgi:hypothetical protein